MSSERASLSVYCICAKQPGNIIGTARTIFAQFLDLAFFTEHRGMTQIGVVLLQSPGTPRSTITKHKHQALHLRWYSRQGFQVLPAECEYGGRFQLDFH